MSEKKKILFITPHLSTGGAPQVTLNKIELLKDEYNILCVEYSFIAWSFVVQRNKIINLLGDNFISLPEDKSQILNVINQFKPDVISFEEFPEFFMDDSITREVYKKDRSYSIFETTHDSSFPVEHKRFFPDKFHFVSAFNAFRYSVHDIPYEIIEYPVDFKVKNQKQKQDELNFDSSWKHVVNVGLFTPRKNQSYLFELSEYLKDYKIKFHFIGNQADNFKHYWEPLMNNKPKNCVVWGERSDVDSFLQASDLFFFASRGDRNNKELNPIAIKEALEYKMPMMMYNLDVYCGKYNNEESITFLTGDLKKDAENMISILNPEKDITFSEDELIIISTYPDTTDREQLTIDCINSFRKTGKKIALVSHYPVNDKIQKLVDYYIFDSNNLMIKHSYYNKFYNYKPNYDVEINLNSLTKTNQSLAALINFQNGVKFAKQLGVSKVMIVTYDVILNELDIPTIEEYFNKLDDWKCCIAYMNTELGIGVETTSMVFRTDYFMNIFPDVRDEENFNQLCNSVGSQNFLEDYFYKTIKDEIGLWVEPNTKTILHNSGIGVSSCSEYMSIVPIEDEPNKLMFYFYTYNIDNKSMKVRIYEGMELIFSELFKIKTTNEFYTEIKFDGKPIKVIVDRIDGNNVYKTETFEITGENFSDYSNNGLFKQKNKYKIKLVHLQTTRNDEREQKSFESVSRVADYGIEYVLHRNDPYQSLPPSHNCLRPDCVSMTLFDEETTNRLGTALTPAHYGCYESFRTGILSEFDNDLDFLIVCEGDCIIEVPIEEFVNKVQESAKLIKKHNIGYFSFGDVDTLDFGWKQSNVVEEIPNQDLIFITNKIIGLQCIMFPKSHRSFLLNNLRYHPWDAADMYFNTIFFNGNQKMGILKERITTQADGYSLIDNQFKEFRKK
jgi:hypothetical protein